MCAIKHAHVMLPPGPERKVGRARPPRDTARLPEASGARPGALSSDRRNPAEPLA